MKLKTLGSLKRLVPSINASAERHATRCRVLKRGEKIEAGEAESENHSGSVSRERTVTKVSDGVRWLIDGCSRSRRRTKLLDRAEARLTVRFNVVATRGETVRAATSERASVHRVWQNVALWFSASDTASLCSRRLVRRKDCCSSWISRWNRLHRILLRNV